MYIHSLYDKLHGLRYVTNLWCILCEKSKFVRSFCKSKFVRLTTTETIKCNILFQLSLGLQANGSDQCLDLGNVGGLGVGIAHSLAVVPRLPLGLALEVQKAGLICIGLELSMVQRSDDYVQDPPVLQSPTVACLYKL